jgi:predicted polyphosphate/ATP-dependent NAD kinase
MVELLDFIPTDQPEDTVKAVEMMKSKGIDCLIILGGDGTCRLDARTDISVPVILIISSRQMMIIRKYIQTIQRIVNMKIICLVLAMKYLEHTIKTKESNGIYIYSTVC